MIPEGPGVAVSLILQEYRPNQRSYGLQSPITGKSTSSSRRILLEVSNPRWRLLAEGRIVFWERWQRDAIIEVRTLTMSDGIVPWTWWPTRRSWVNRRGQEEIQSSLAMLNAFDTPKPERLIHRILTSQPILATSSSILSLVPAPQVQLPRRWVAAGSWSNLANTAIRISFPDSQKSSTAQTTAESRKP